MKTKNLILVRGVSGSGKTTFARLMGLGIGLDTPIFSADDYFENDESGEYEFDPGRLRFAHEDCQLKTENAMKLEFEDIFVANTFTREWEMEAYIKLAEKYGYRVFSIIVENRHGGENVHDVPVETIKAQKDRFEIKL